MNNNKLLIFGAGGHAKKVALQAQANGYSIIGAISTESIGTPFLNSIVLGNISDYLINNEFKAYLIHIAIGENSVRKLIYDQIVEYSDRLTSIFSLDSHISNYSIIGRGTYIGTGACILNNVNIGENCIIDTNVIVDHDTMISDFVNISPGAVLCSHINVGYGAIIGAGATIIERVNIGEGSLIGAGSVVIKDVEPFNLVVGSPAKLVKRRSFYDMYLKK